MGATGAAERLRDASGGCRKGPRCGGGEASDSASQYDSAAPNCRHVSSLGHPGPSNAAIMRPISDPIKYVFSRDIRRTRARISLDTGGRLGFPRRDCHVQKSLNPLRCQPMTVSSLTITRAWRQPGHRQDRMTQKTLSAFRSDGRGQLCQVNRINSEISVNRRWPLYVISMA